MHYEGTIFRPPSEADSILLQVTTGCSHNNCSFCGMYKGIRFSIKDDEAINADIAEAARLHRRQRRVFLCDGDALIIPQHRLRTILAAIARQLPWVERVGTYATPRSIEQKTPEALAELRSLGLGIVYLGVESGDNTTLSQIGKGADAAAMIAVGRKIRAVGIKLSVTVLLGIAEPGRSHQHATATGQVLTAIDPEYVGALSLMLVPNTTLYARWQDGSWQQPGPRALLEELGVMIANTDLSDGLFHANHASNYLPLRARLPHDKERALTLIRRALEGKIALQPESYRGL